jgi:hypothetical protein
MSLRNEQPDLVPKQPSFFGFFFDQTKLAGGWLLGLLGLFASYVQIADAYKFPKPSRDLLLWLTQFVLVPAIIVFPAWNIYRYYRGLATEWVNPAVRGWLTLNASTTALTPLLTLFLMYGAPKWNLGLRVGLVLVVWVVTSVYLYWSTYRPVETISEQEAEKLQRAVELEFEIDLDDL